MSSLLEEVSPSKKGYATFSLETNEKHYAPKRSFFHRMLFAQANPIMDLGNQRQLEMNDLWDLEGEDRTDVAFDHFTRNYEYYNKSVPKAILSTYGRGFFLCGVAALFSMGCGVFAPAVIGHVINAFKAPELDMEDLTVWLGVFFASRFLNAIISAQMNYYMEMIALRLTVSLKSLLFKKAMRRSIQSKNDKEAVDISNLYTSDVQSILWAAFQINNLWILPIQVSIVVYMLYSVLDLAAFAGLSVIGLSMLVGFFIAKFQSVAFDGIMEAKDTRMKTIKEVFGAIQIVKFNAWESKFMEKIHALRMDEVKFIARNMYWGAVSIFVLWSSPLFVSMTSFAVYSLVMGKTLSASQVFPAMALFNALRDPLRDLPSVVQTVIQSKVSIDRISSFLNLHEYDPAAVDRNGSAYPKDIAIYVENATFGWTKESPLLKDVNIQVKKGDFVIIHGSVGSGKSSLCAALLGEMEKLSGKVFVRGSVAYYSQQSWIQNMTIRENILFGTAFDEKRYKAVVEACGLIPDFMQLPGGDQTEIGQKGVNLSGGQKARVSLARACYANSDILILDSPLAAVDAVVQSEIFSNCLCKYLEEKTIILVTHSHDIITSDASNYKILMEDGVLKGERVEVTKPRSSYASSPKSKKLNTEDVHAATNKDASKGGLVEEEEREEGRVSADVFSKYFDALGGKFVVVWLFLVQLLWQVFQIASDFWLSHWTGQKNAAYDESRTKYNMRVYSLLGFGSAMMVFIRAMTVAFVGLRASRHLFDSMTHSLLHAPLRFFDANPIGRIVNRYGDDLTSVDLMLPFAYGGFLATFFFTVCQLATAVYTVKILGLLVIPLVYLYVSIGNYYLAPSREISRSWKVSSSPVLSHVTQSEEGVAIIRAFGPDYVDRAISDNHVRIDVSNKVWYSETLTGQWFAVRMQLLGCGIVILVVSALVILKDHMAPGIVGLAFTYAISVDGGLVSLVRVWSWVEICMVSPERILEYAAIPPEGSNNMLVVEPSSQWPQDGSIKFENVVFSYKADAAPVLKGMSFSIGSREKIGIVGRTGAGKSSLTMALFRINELVSGCITIDGVDISSMSLRTLRSRLSIIPQSPVLFKGTLRAYMDPFNEFEDEKIWAAFAKVHLTDMISNLDGKLMHELSENGENFSVGERQMLCMARALLNKSRIVIMDEATASIDHATEKKLQEMINRDFSEATVLTIAHRLATVLDSDRIMVLSDGKVVEFDSPKKLVKKEKGVFYQLAKEGGYLDQIR